jgi:hypothetical protein
MDDATAQRIATAIVSESAEDDFRACANVTHKDFQLLYHRRIVAVLKD